MDETRYNTTQEDRDALRAAKDMRNVVSLGDAMKEVLPKMQATQKRLTKMFDELRAKIKPEFEKRRFKICEHHPKQKIEANWQDTVDKSFQPNELRMVYDPCPICKEQALVNEKNAFWQKRGIPEKVLHATFNNYELDPSIPSQAEAMRRFIAQIARGVGFIIACGTHGCGKSHLLAATLKKKGGGLMITEAALVDQLRNSYDKGGKVELIEKYRKAEILILDELDPKIKGDDIEPFLYEILAWRYDHDMLTGIGSNEDLHGVLAILGKKLEDRMAQNYVVANFNWISYRRLHAVE